MRVKKVNRYYCEFCKKAGCSGGHIRKHEASCTMNPYRICRMCKMVDAEQVTPVSELVSLLPDIKDFTHTEYFDNCGTSESINGTALNDALSKSLPTLRKKTGGCPACMMAALRQAKIPLPVIEGFNYTEECKSVWAKINNEQYEESCRQALYG